MAAQDDPSGATGAAGGRDGARIRTLANTALDADVTIDQATAMPDGLGTTMENVDRTMTDFVSTSVRMNRDLEVRA